MQKDVIIRAELACFDWTISALTDDIDVISPTRVGISVSVSAGVDLFWR